MNHAMRMALWEAQGRACVICDRALRQPQPSESPKDPDAPTKDHVIPQQAGGIIALLAHRRCNHDKANRAPTERELQRIDTTLKHLEAWALRELLTMCADKVAHADKAAREARSALMVVLRFAPTSEAASALRRLEPDAH